MAMKTVGRSPALGEQGLLRALAEVLRGERQRALHADVAQPGGVLLFAVPQDDDLRWRCVGARGLQRRRDQQQQCDGCSGGCMA